MGPEMYAEAVELITIAVDKHANSKNYEAAATMVKVSEHSVSSLTAPRQRYRLFSPSSFTAVFLRFTSLTPLPLSTHAPCCFLYPQNTFDKKFGNYWHVAIGEGFGFEVTHQQRHLMYVLFGTLGVLCYKM